MKTIIKKIKSMDYQRIIISVSIAFSVLTGIIGYEKLSIGYAIIFAMLCALNSMLKDLKELGDAWKEYNTLLILT